MQHSKQLLKFAIVFVLIALLLVPTWLITNLVTERQTRQQDIVKEITKTWAAPQVISTPFIQTIYNKLSTTGAASNVLASAFIFPQISESSITATPQTVKRSIYRIPVYQAAISQKGTINKSAIENFTTTYGTIQWQRSYLAITITDAKGVLDSATITLNGKAYSATVLSNNVLNGQKTLGIPLTILEASIPNDINYQFDCSIKGTEKLSIMPLAASNKISMKSSWKDPSFEGITAVQQAINNTGFTAQWNISGASLSIPTIATALPEAVDHTISVKLINPVDNYTQTQRCIKYAILIIGLTFAFFFFMELLKQLNIHPFQYLLVGLALVIFYTLLLSISEYIDFSLAYTIAATATIILISYYTISVLRSMANGIQLGVVLTVLYGFLYLIIQMEDSSLLVGSIGLFVTLAIVMQISKRIQWNKIPNGLPQPKNTTL